MTFQPYIVTNNIKISIDIKSIKIKPLDAVNDPHINLYNFSKNIPWNINIKFNTVNYQWNLGDMIFFQTNEIVSQDNMYYWPSEMFIPIKNNAIDINNINNIDDPLIVKKNFIKYKVQINEIAYDEFITLEGNLIKNDDLNP